MSGVGSLVESNSLATQSTQTASDQGRLIAGKGTIYTESGALSVARGGSYSEGLNLADAKGDNRIGSTEIGGNVSIMNSDAELLTTALNTVGSLSKSSLDSVGQLAGQFSGSLGDFAMQTQEGQASQLKTLLGALGQLKDETSTDGARDRTILFLVLGLLAVVAFIFFPRKK